MLGKAYVQPRRKISERIIGVNTGQYVKTQGIQRMILKFSDGNSRPRPRHIEIAHSTYPARYGEGCQADKILYSGFGTCWFTL